MLLRFLLTTFIILFSPVLKAFNEVEVAKSLGLELVSEGHPYNFLGVNTVYINDDMSRQMLVVSNVQGELKSERIFHHKGFLIFEIPKSSQSYVSIAFVGIKEAEVREKIKTSSVWKKIFMELSPVQRAYGDDCGPPGFGILTGISDLAGHYGSSIMKSALKCMDQIKDGVKEKAKEEIDEMVTLFTNPMKFWEEKVAALKNIGELITQFDVKLKQMSVALTKLPPSILGTFLCGFVGGLGTRAFLAMVSGGAGAAKLLLSLEEFVSKLINLEKAFSVLAKSGKLATIPKSFIERLSLGKIPDEQLKSIDTLAKHDFPDFVQGAMACSM